VAGLLATMGESDLDDVFVTIARLSPEGRHAVRANLTVLSLIESRRGMPDPVGARPHVTRLLARIEGSTRDE
jgi:hypothetical protein